MKPISRLLFFSLFLSISFLVIGQVEAACGDGTIDAGEACDGTNFGDYSTCESLSSTYTGGAVLTCQQDCLRIDTSACTVITPSSADQASPSQEPGPVFLENPLGKTTDIYQIIGRVIKTMLGVLGSLSLLVFVFGAFNWITSAGNATRVQTGMKTMLFAVIGLFIIFAAYGIMSALFTVLGAAGG